MHRSGVMLLIGALLLAFGIFFGIELAQRGMERVYGPLDSQARAAVPIGSQTDAAGKPSGAVAAVAASGERKAGQAGSTASRPPGSIVPSAAETTPVFAAVQPVVSDSLVNRIGNKTGDLLQRLAHHSIDALVSLLDAIFK